MSGLVSDRTTTTASGAPAAPAPRAGVDPAVWPDAARVPRSSPLRTAVARLLVGRAFARLPLRVRLPDGTLNG